MNSIDVAKSVIEDPEYPASVAKMTADFLEAIKCLEYYSSIERYGTVRLTNERLCFVIADESKRHIACNFLGNLLEKLK